jgi:fused signal recognition particle receptor
MSLFSKFKDLISRKQKVSSQIESLNEQKIQVEQIKFDQGLKKTASSLQQSIDQIATKYRRLDDNLIQSIEETLISFDLGVKPAQKILDAIVDEIKYQNVTDPKLIKQIIVDKIFIYYIQNTTIDANLKLLPQKNNVILVSGVNGVGKTTSIAKLAHLLKQKKFKVCLVAADTFRAGAIEQLTI